MHGTGSGGRIIIMASWLGWFSVFLARFAPSPVLLLIEREFGLSHGEASLIFTSYLAAYSVMQIPAGILSDILGPRRIISIGLIVMGLSTLAMGFSQSFPPMILYAFLSGIGAGTFYTSSTSLVSLIFPPKERGRVLGIAYSGIGAGTSMAIVAGGFLGNIYGWRLLFLLSSIPGIISSILFLHGIKRDQYDLSQTKSRSSILGLEMLRARALQVYMAAHALILITYFGVTSFTPTYIASSSGLGIVEANLVFLAFPLSEILGGLIGGYLTDKLGAWRISITSFIVASIAVALIPLAYPPIYVVLLLPLIGFMFRTAATALPLLVVESTPPNIVGTMLGWYNSIGFLGASVGPYMFGIMADKWGFSLSYITISIFPLASIPMMMSIKNTSS